MCQNLGPPEQGGGQGGRQPTQRFLSMRPFFEEPLKCPF